MKNEYFIRIIDMDERGTYAARIVNTDNETIYSYSDDNGSLSLVDHGFMKHKDDLRGLRDYLIEIGILDKSSVLISGTDSPTTIDL